MKKRIVIYVYLLLFLSITAKAQVTFTLRAGLNLQNINGKNSSGDVLSNEVGPRYNVAGLVNFPVAPDFSVQTGVVFETKGAKVINIILGTKSVDDTRLNYLQVPVTFMYAPLVGQGHVLMGFGPYVAYGIGGTVKTNANPSRKVIWQSEVEQSEGGDAFYKPLEFGANFLFGYEFFHHLQLQLNAQLGLTKINPKDARITNDKTAKKNTGFGLSLGWKF